MRSTTSSRSTAPCEELADGPALARPERLDGAEPVDEDAVARVGGHPARRRVRRVDEALLLEQGHVVAHRSRADPEVVALDERLAPDRLGGLDVVLHDRAQHHQPAVLAHRPSFTGLDGLAALAGLALSIDECQVYVVSRRSPISSNRRRRRVLCPPRAAPAPSRRRRPAHPRGVRGGRRPRHTLACRVPQRSLRIRRAQRRLACPEARPVDPDPRRARPRRRGGRDGLGRRRRPRREGGRHARRAPRGPSRTHQGVPARARASSSTGPR